MSNTAPQMTGDNQSVRIHFQDSTGEIRVYQIQPSVPTMRVRWFGDDTDMHSTAFAGFAGFPPTLETAFGYGIARHFNFRAGNAASTQPFSGTCNLPPLTDLLRTGNTNSSLCYGGEVGTGDTLINHRFSAASQSTAFGKYFWRQCNIGFGADLTSPCDEVKPLSFFPTMDITQEVRLRAKVFIPSAVHSSVGASTSAAGISIRLVSALTPAGPIQARELELTMLIFLDNVGAQCISDSFHDAEGRHIFTFTPACVGASSIIGGQSLFYNLNLRSFIAMKFQDHFADSFGGHHNDLPAYNLTNWRVTWGGAYFLDRTGFDSASIIMDDLSVEVKY